ncbi:DNA-3-methyladenine glycosylase [Geoalkalibacter sp.]|uniref:DNA-3-methyladenine glycosylase n=1 Tax=Geoalkalibacter sp. TaxID=3041440 RepID=UPI00272EC28B|nr:DNA-3-methyladenine glycosylase [Geoalkalibacter sp.]
MHGLSQSFYQRDTIEVARALLGRVLISRTPEGETSGMIVETEAYLGARDRASHAFGDRRTARTASLYVPAGRAYVYLIYGLHHCLNLTTGTAEDAECVLIRALEPLEGLALMAKRRKTSRPELLASGPGRLCQALGIDRSFNGESLSGPRLLVGEGRAVPDTEIVTAARIGIDYAGEARDWPLRFFLADHACVSRLK